MGSTGFSWKLADHPKLPKNKLVAMIVLDGWGEASPDKYNCIHVAETPTMDSLKNGAPDHWRLVRAHGTAVGLPTEDDMGNSEVGHNALGAGRIFAQGAKLVDQALASGRIYEDEGFNYIKESFATNTLHLIGLMSDGGVHSRLDQLQLLLNGASERGAKKIRVHVLTDGRDVLDGSSVGFAETLEAELASLRSKGIDAQVASGGGRMYVTMDRYENDWEVVKRGWDAQVLGEAPHKFKSVVEAIKTLRQAPGANDQYLPPFVIVDDSGSPVGPVVDGDAVVTVNFRADRMTMLAQALEYEKFDKFDRVRFPKIRYAGMLQYDGELKLPNHYLVSPPLIDRTSGEYLVHNGVRTFACSETVKFGHVTFFWNGKGEHCERICIEGCLNRDEIKDGSLVYSLRCHNSRFLGGRCYKYKDEFKARVRADFLSPQITYTVNLVFRYRDKWSEWFLPELMPIRYKLDGETKLITICNTKQGEDGWFMAELHQCNSEHGSFEIMFERFQLSLLVAGIEFQPFKEKIKVEDDEVLEYQDIIKAASHSLAYRSLAELKVLLSKGIHLNEYQRWFSLNENGDNCEMISIAECLIPDESNKDYVFHYDQRHYRSRFPAGPYKTTNKGFRVHVKTQFLSPLTTYTVNLVFSYPAYPYGGYELEYLGLQYKLEGETETSTVYFADRRKNGFYWAELYQFTSDGRSVDLIIIFEEFEGCLEVEGIMFQPLKKVDNQLSEDEKVDIQTVINSKIMKVSKDSTEWTTKKDRYSFLCQCFRNENSQELYSVDKNGKKCLKLSAQAACYVYDSFSTWESSPDSSFGEVVVGTGRCNIHIRSCIKSQVVSPKTTYACYLVYKLPQDQSTPAAFMKVNKAYDSWYICLVSPPYTQVTGQKLDINTHNLLSRAKLNAKPQQRSDGRMEVKLWEFYAQTTFKTVSLDLTLRPMWSTDSRIILEGIELRPI